MSAALAEQSFLTEAGFTAICSLGRTICRFHSRTCVRVRTTCAKSVVLQLGESIARCCLAKYLLLIPTCTAYKKPEMEAHIRTSKEIEAEDQTTYVYYKSKGDDSNDTVFHQYEREQY